MHAVLRKTAIYSNSCHLLYNRRKQMQQEILNGTRKSMTIRYAEICSVENETAKNIVIIVKSTAANINILAEQIWRSE